jgi:signal transduction histidine kinase
MKSMIDDLLDYSRVQTSAEEASRVELDEALTFALRTLAPRIEETGGRVNVDRPLPVVEGSPAQFERLLRNLVSNAIKFHGDEPPVITVSAEEGEGEWVVAVRDNGIGIDPAKAERIFELFQRLHSQDEYAGTGMGLAICKRIVERHGGRIWVDPVPDGGSVFRFTLPA